MEVCVEIEVLLNTQVFVQAELLRHVADAVLHRLRVARYVRVENRERARIGAQKARGQTHEGRLAGAVRTDDRVEGTGSRTEAHAIERRESLARFPAEGLPQVTRVDRRAGAHRAAVAGASSCGGASGSRTTVAGMPRRNTFRGSSTMTRSS